jgi:transposase
MYKDIIQWTKIRRRLMTGSISQRQIGRQAGISRTTLRKMLQYAVPPGRRRKAPIKRPKLGPWLGTIDEILEDDKNQSTKQRHTAKRIFDRLREKHGYTGGYTTVKEYVRKAKQVRPKAVCEWEDPAQLTYTLVQSLAKREGIQLLHMLFSGGTLTFNAKKWEHLISPFITKETARQRKRLAAFDWMRQVVQGVITADALSKEMDQTSIRDTNRLLTTVVQGRLSVRNRALTVLARQKGISCTNICDFLNMSKASVLKYCQLYHKGGMELLMARQAPSTIKYTKDTNKHAVFALIHTPPSAHGINRTTWKIDDLKDVLRRQNQPLCEEVIHKILKQAGYRWRKARIVLTSADPKYRAKVDAIKKILSELKPDEAFFSIDEYGPFAVKQKGGIKRVAPGARYVVPQWQKSKGWMILTAALELSRNQVSHFYSLRKNTDEMIKMADLLRTQYRVCRTIYLSWDAASWHVSKKLVSHLEKINQQAVLHGFPIVKTAPLPAGAQFLNVIESVFSGMARAIIHNSDYPNLGAAKDAINRHFKERNEHFCKHPKRAGQKIWGKELVPSEFIEGQNCKDPLYR